MKSTQERFREIQEYLHKRCNTDPQVIKEREEFFSRPIASFSIKFGDLMKIEQDGSGSNNKTKE